MTSTIEKPAIASIPIRERIEILKKSAPSFQVASSVEDLIELATGGKDQSSFEVAYELPDGKSTLEANVVRVKNGIAANYPDAYLRRRDPDSMAIADDYPTDKERFSDRFGYSFESLKDETFDWLSQQDLAMFYFHAGKPGLGYDGVAIIPANAGFFGLGLALLQGILDPQNLPEDFDPKAAIYVAPPFRHTHFDGKQVVVHERQPDQYEMFSYNLYPGPSAKKGVYGMLIHLGNIEHWITAHCATVRVVTPYDNVVTIMHEGASGGGKSEMLQQPHRQVDGSLLLGENVITKERLTLELRRTCDLQPVTDDMALCHKSLHKNDKKLTLMDAEEGWFLRVDHIKEYGTDPLLERITAKPPQPLLFLNIEAVPGGRALIWDHVEDKPGVPCPNPRVIMPRAAMKDIYNDAVTVDIRSMGIRTPQCTSEKPTYGIIGMMHVLPPALAWLWRLVAPRGHANPSITDTKGLTSEGVGSFWPFAAGRRVTQANLILEQMQNTPKTKYVLLPNQHIGAYKTGFMPQWVSREYLARRGNANFTSEQVSPSRCSLLGYALNGMRVEGDYISRGLLKVESQPEVGKEAYDQGAQILSNFFHEELTKFLADYLNPMGRKIIECCMDGGSVEDYEAFKFS
ncbi:DUF4914 family protein [Fulvivirga sp. M361]|uniref:DUF4914 family protein n=1 Tax=Fulvivirga sp. M361 TaxID=2594266 RepID=UPI00117B11F3|nr:DUF4914 family protein [Fulvivirga sp. M361]TRX52048.1 DUF4914 family protein [Fulvivirga sp. M361]